MSKILNHIIISLLLSLLALCWVKYLTKSSTLSWLVALLVLLIYYAVVKFVDFSSKSKVPKSKSVSKKQVDSLIVALATHSDATSIIANMYNYYNYSVTQTPDYITATKDNVTKLVICNLDMSILQASTISKAVKMAHVLSIDNVVIMYYQQDHNSNIAISYLDTINLQLVDCFELYSLLNESHLLPKLATSKSKPQGIVAKYALCRARCWQYATSAIFLTVISIISYFPLYTLIWSSGLAALSIYCYFNKRYNKSASLSI